jgi:hypothetical protein
LSFLDLEASVDQDGDERYSEMEEEEEDGKDTFSSSGGN